MGEAKRKAAQRSKEPHANWVRPQGQVLTWELFYELFPNGARCNLCGDKIKNEPVRQDSSGDVYYHVACCYCLTCHRADVDCHCRRVSVK